MGDVVRFESFGGVSDGTVQSYTTARHIIFSFAPDSSQYHVDPMLSRGLSGATVQSSC